MKWLFDQKVLWQTNNGYSVALFLRAYAVVRNSIDDNRTSVALNVLLSTTAAQYGGSEERNVFAVSPWPKIDTIKYQWRKDEWRNVLPL